MRQQFVVLLHDMKFLPYADAKGQDVNRYSSKLPDSKAKIKHPTGAFTGAGRENKHIQPMDSPSFSPMFIVFSALNNLGNRSFTGVNGQYLLGYFFEPNYNVNSCK